MSIGSLNQHRRRSLRTAVVAATAAACMAIQGVARAQDVAEAQGRVSTFLNNLNALLNLASVAVVTIAIIFAGYQIAFNHKRISDVAPVLLGGFLIGAAAQIAKMLVPETVGASVAGGAAIGGLLPWLG